MLTAFVTKILSAVLKKAAAMAGLRLISEAFTILSWFETIRSVHECAELPRCVVEVAYDTVVDHAVDELVAQVVENRFDVTRTESGLYVASHSSLLQPHIQYPPAERWSREQFSESFAYDWARQSTTFESELERQRRSFTHRLSRDRDS